MGGVGFLLILTLSLVFGPKKVSVIVDNEIYEIITFKSTVKDVLGELNLNLREEDRINIELTAKLKNNLTIQIDTAEQYIIYHDGKETIVLYPDPELDVILALANIELGELDIVEGDLEQEKKIYITRVKEEIVTETARIFFQEKRVANNDMLRGQTRILQQGHEGVKELTYKVVYHDEKQVEKTLLEERIVKEKQDRIVEYGTIEAISRGGRLLAVRRMLTVTATAYCSGVSGTGCPVDHRGWTQCTGPYANGYTSIGWPAIAGNGSRENPHIVAVDPSRIPLRSLLYIEGLGFAYAADVGSAIKGNRIDILMPTHYEAWRFGRQTRVVYIIDREL